MSAVAKKESKRDGPRGCGPACRGAVSPSDLDTYRRMCQRRWGFKKLAKLPEPVWSFQESGIETHGYLERYLSYGELPDTSRQPGVVAMKMIPSLPLPDPEHVCEGHIHFEEDSVRFHGYVDLQPKPEETLVVEVVDFKTISVGRERFKWVKTWEQIKDDSQVLVYGMYKLRQNPRAARVRFRWVYAERSKPFGVKVVECTITRVEVERRFYEEILPAAREILAHREKQPGTDPVEYVNGELAYNLDACSAYGGCPFAGHCKLPKRSTKEKLMADWKMMAARIAQKTVAGKTVDSPKSLKGKPAAAPKKPRTSINPEPEEEDVPEVEEETPEEDPAEDEAAPAPKAAKKRPAARKPAAKKDAALGDFVLAVDCLPSGTVPYSALGGFTSVVKERLDAQAQEEHGVACFELTEEAGFGRRDAVFLAAFQQYMADMDLRGVLVVADSSDPYQSATLPWLRSTAETVWSGVRR